MPVFDERPAPSPARRRLLLLGLPVLGALVWVVAAHSPHGVKQAIKDFRGDAPAETTSNSSMTEALLIRRDLLLHPGMTLSQAQGHKLVGLVSSPVNDQSQSEALDVLCLAQRAHALPAPQARDAETATLGVLRGGPGPMVRLESARFFGHLGNPADASALTALQQDSDPKVRQAAGEALARLTASKS